MKNYLVTLSLCILFSIASKAQQDLTLFNFNDIPQSSYSNPANQFNGKFFIGLPVLSSSYYSLSNSGFKYSDFIKKDGDSLRLDFNSMISGLEEENFMSFNTKIDLISFGFKVGKKTQIMFNVTENINFRFNYTKDLVTFIHKGNLAFDDNTADFTGTAFSANYYREYGVSLAHQFSDKLRLGARLKYLYGLANLDTKRSDLKLTTDTNTYALTATSDILINTSGNTDFLSSSNLTGEDGFLFGTGNRGFGVDLGINYELNGKLSFNASVLDLGFINWNANTTNYNIDKGRSYFDGIEIDAFSPQDDTTGTSSYDRLVDSLEVAFNVQETNKSYTNPLVGRIYMGANYKFNEKLVFGGLIQSEFYKRNIKPSLTLSTNYKVSKWIGVAASYSMINRSFNNLGIGININPGPVQIYIVSDNILSGFRPQHAIHTQVRAGVNFIFGSDKMNEINTSYDEITNVKREKRSRRNAEEDEAQPSTQVTLLVPEVPQSDTIASPNPTEKVNRIIENTTDAVKQKVEIPKSGERKTIIEAVQENQEKIKAKADSAANFGKPMIHPVAPETNQDSSAKEVKSEAK